MAGLLFIMEFRHWTHEEASDAYISNIDVHYALNLQQENQSLRHPPRCSKKIHLSHQDEIQPNELLSHVSTKLLAGSVLIVSPGNATQLLPLLELFEFPLAV